MTENDIFWNLCHFDRRWPDYFADDDDDVTPRQNCFCDNCFYRRDALAVELLKARDEIVALYAARSFDQANRYAG